MVAGKDVLEKIPGLVQKKDAAALVGLRDHEDKAVRKAVRKALHLLKSKGVEIPDAPAQAWSTGATLKQMRGNLEPNASVDALTTPGVLRFMLSEPDAESGARLFAGALSADDRVLEFEAFMQTDGQRTRLLKDWEKRAGDRRIDTSWLKARIRFARENTIRSGYPVPRALDQVLTLLGDAADSRPEPFLVDRVAGEAPLDASAAQSLLEAIRVPQWPPMVELDNTLQKAATIHGDKPQPTEEADRLELLAQSCKGDETARKGLAGPVANALEDAAVHVWLEGDKATGRAVLDMAQTLRTSSEAETIPWAVRLLGYQVASLLRALGGPQAVAKAQAEMARQQGA
jgi:hypothetical protein